MNNVTGGGLLKVVNEERNSCQVEIVAEIANAHQGVVENARRIAIESIEVGADAVKFQVYFAEEFLVPTHTRFQHFKNQAFSKPDWIWLLRQIKDTSARVYCDVFGVEAFNVALSCGVDGVKVHGSDLGNDPLLSQIGNSSLDVIISAGGSTYVEIAHAVKLLRSKNQNKITLLHGHQSYPTEIDDSVLARMSLLEEMFGKYCDIGYQDHVSGESDMAYFLPVMAVGMGAKMIEKHVTLDRNAKGVDYYSSLNPEELGSFIRIIRQCEVARGVDGHVWSEGERKYRRDVKKHAVARCRLKKGTLIKAEDLSFLRVVSVDSSPSPLSSDSLLGSRLKEDIDEHVVIHRALIETRVAAIIVARRGSRRLPDKALLDMNGEAALSHLFRRVKQSKSVDEIIFCTTTESENRSLCLLAEREGLNTFCGSIKDVLGRMLTAIENRDIDVVVRVTGDDILVDPDYIDRAVDYHLNQNFEYTDLKKLPSGTEVEIFDTSLLKRLNRLVINHDDTEYLTNFVVDNRYAFQCGSAPVDDGHSLDWRLTLDTKDDAEVIRKIIEEMDKQGRKYTYRLDDIVTYLNMHPEILELNSRNQSSHSLDKNATRLDWSKLIHSID